MGKFVSKQEKIKKTPKQIIITISIVLVAVILLGAGVYGILDNTGMLQSSITAVKIGNEKIRVTEYNFNYSNIYSNYISTYADYMQYIGLDTSKPLNSQAYGDGTETWAQFFHDETIRNLEEMLALCNEANTKGYKLSDASKQNIENFVKQLKTDATAGSMTFSQYITQLYGPGSTEDTVRHDLERNLLSFEYYNEKLKTYTYTDDQLEIYYSNNKDPYDVVDIMEFDFNISPDIDTSDTNAVKTAMDQIKPKADEMLSKITDKASFASAAIEFASTASKDSYKDPDSTLTKNALKTSLATEVGTWAFDANTKTLDKTVITNPDSLSVVLMITPRRRLDEVTVNMRHILFTPAKDENATTSTPEQIKAAEDKANNIYQQWKDGGATEDLFIKLANENTDDPGSKTTGGLYENVSKGEMVPEIDQWLFSADRKTGDNAVIKTDYGYHITYFLKTGEPKWKADVKSAMQSADIQKFLDDKAKENPATVTSYTQELIKSK